MTTSQENFAALKPLMQEIALQLTKQTAREWTLRKSEDGEYTYFHLDSGTADLCIHAVNYGSNDRITIGGITPRDPKTRQYVRVYVPSATGGWDEFKFSSITVSTKKSAETITKDIVRRFLPDYLEAVALTIAVIQRDAQYAADKRTNLEACAATLDATLRSDMRPIHGCDDVYEPLGLFSMNIGDTIRVEVKASANDVDVKFENLTVKQAQMLLSYAKNISVGIMFPFTATK
jgi:hypothetical protein